MQEQGTEARDFIGELHTDGKLSQEQTRTLRGLINGKRILYSKHQQAIRSALGPNRVSGAGLILIIASFINSTPVRP